MATQAIRCPHCTTVLKLPHQESGPIQGKCPKCAAEFEIAQPKPAVEATEGPRPVPGRPGSGTHPAAGAGKRSSGGWMLAAGAVVLVLGVLGTGCAGVGIWFYTTRDQQPIAKNSPDKAADKSKDVAQVDGAQKKKNDDGDKKKAPPKKEVRVGYEHIPFDAVAPLAKLEQIKAVQIKGKSSGADGSNVHDVVISWESVKRFKHDNKTARETSNLVLIRDHGWSIEGEKILALDRDSLESHQNLNYAVIVADLIALTDDGFKILKGDESVVRGKKCFNLLVLRDDRPTIKLSFDSGTKLLFKSELKGRFFDAKGKLTPDDIQVEFYFTIYLANEGINHWRKVEQFRDGARHSEIIVSDVKFLARADDALFLAPGIEKQVADVQASYKIADARDLIKRALDHLGADAGSDFSRLAAGLGHKETDVRTAAKNALRAYGQLWRIDQMAAFERADIGALVALIKSSDDAELRSVGIDGVARLGMQADQAVTPLLTLAKEGKDPAVLASVMVALRHIGVRSDETLRLLETHIDNSALAVRDAAALGLVQLAPEKVTSKSLAEFMGRPNKVVSAAAGRLLRQRLSTVTAKDLPELKQGLRSPARDARLAYIDAVSSLKAEGRDAVPELTILVGSSDSEVSTQAIRALDSMDKLVEVTRTSSDSAVLTAALDALKTKALKTDEALAVYQKHLDHVDAGVKLSAAMALLELGPDRLTTDRLTDMMGWPTEEVRTGAGKLLRKKLATLTPQDMAAVRQGLKSPVREIRLAFIEALGTIKGASAEAVPELTSLLTSTEKDVAIQACWALEKMGKSGEKAVPALVKTVDAADKSIGIAATLALFRIDPANAVLKTKGAQLLVEDLKPDTSNLKAFLANPVQGTAALTLLDFGEPGVEPMFQHLMIKNNPVKLPEDQQIEGTASRLLAYELLKKLAKRATDTGDRNLAAALKKKELTLERFWSKTEKNLALQVPFRADLSADVKMLYLNTSVAVDSAHRAIQNMRVP